MAQPVANTNRDLVLAGNLPERLISDEMGFEVLKAVVGPVTFTIHKNLLAGSSPRLAKLISKNSDNGTIQFPKENPEIFKLFIEFLYSRRVPGVTIAMEPLVQAARLRDLCQFYAFADRVKLHNEWKNKIMDKIQDGFMMLDKIPEVALANAIFHNTPGDSLLRKFAASSLLFYMRSDAYDPNCGLGDLLSKNKDVMNELVIAIKEFTPTEDPRVRKCGAAVAYCVECESNLTRLEGVNGTDPCRYHQHQAITKGEDGIEVITADQSCHLWKAPLKNFYEL